MKKLGIYLLIIMCLFITGCGEEKTKTVNTLEEFERVSTENGFSVENNIRVYAGASYILEAKIAKYDDVEIEMIKYSDSDYASQVQEQQIESFNLLKSTGAFVEKEKGANYYNYVLVSNNRYMVSTRIDNTLIFAKCMIEDRESVEAVINSLGY